MLQSFFVLAQLFRQPMNISTTATSLLWVLPIGLGISLVYKAIKLEDITPRLFVREVALLFVTGLGMLLVTMVILLGIARLAGQI